MLLVSAASPEDWLRTANTAWRVSLGSPPLSSPIIRELNSSSVTAPSLAIVSNTTFPLASRFLIDFLFWNPRATIARFSSDLSIVPPPSVSNISKTSRICANWSEESVIWCPGLLCPNARDITGLSPGFVSKQWQIRLAKYVQQKITCMQISSGFSFSVQQSHKERKRFSNCIWRLKSILKVSLENIWLRIDSETRS